MFICLARGQSLENLAKCTRVILKNLPIKVGLYIGNIKFMLRLFLDEFHEGNDVMKGHNHGYILLFVCQKHNL